MPSLLGVGHDKSVTLILSESCLAKANVVSQDERVKRYRCYFNLGAFYFWPCNLKYGNGVRKLAARRSCRCGPVCWR